MNRRDVLVTGANGMLGGEIVRQLEAYGMGVIGTTRNDLNLEYPENFESIIRSYNPRAIIHSGAYTKVDKSNSEEKLVKQINTDATGELARIANKYRIDFVYISTNEVYKNTGLNGVSENTPISKDPLNAYGRGKAGGEEIARFNNPSTIIVRISWLFGPGERDNLVTKVLKKAQANQEIKGAIDEFGIPTYTVDVAQKLTIVMQNLKRYIGSNIHLINGNKPTSRFDQIQFILNVAGYEIKVAPELLENLGRQVKVPYYGVLINSHQELAMRQWQEATIEYIQNYLQHLMREG